MSPQSPLQKKPLTFWQKYHFYGLLLVAIIIRQLPFISIPFNWLESYFHEISHGIAALVTGGSIVNIQLFANGAGICSTQGGSRFIISFFGYAGATFWGWGIYRLAGAHQRFAQIFSSLIFMLLVSSILLWARDLLTIFILGVLTFIFFVTSYSFFKKTQNLKFLQITVQLFGLLILLNSLFSPLYLLDGRALGDGATLASITFIPEFIWVAIWFLLALGAGYSLMKRK
ncbi:MAG: M50 family metallopeptidase [Colwellia sp.]